MPKLKSSPKYRFHKARNCAVVTIDGKNHYLGPHDSDESWEKYHRLLAERAGNHGLPIVPTATPSQFTVKELCAVYWEFAEGYYLKNGEPTGRLHHVRRALKAVRDLYDSIPAAEFSPLKLQAIQKHLTTTGNTRRYINGLVDVIRRMFKWGVSQELVPPVVHQALGTVPGLRKGRTEAKEKEPISPVSAEIVDATLPHLSPIVADMIRLQRLTGCRPEELCIIRPADIDRSGKVWRYVPESHKTEHHDKQRVVLIGPKGQAILLPYLLRDAQAYCFSPAESEAKRKAELRANRKTPVQPSQYDRSKPAPKRKAGDRYDSASYRRAIHRACDLADVEAHKQANEGCPKNKSNVPENQRIIARWSPNRLRHAAATEIRQRFGLEAAQVTLGHSRADVTQIYAERDLAKASEVMQHIG